MSNQVSKPNFAFEIDGMEFVVEVMFTGNTKDNNSKGQFQRVGTDKTYTLRKAEALKMIASNFDNVVDAW